MNAIASKKFKRIYQAVLDNGTWIARKPAAVVERINRATVTKNRRTGLFGPGNGLAKERPKGGFRIADRAALLAGGTRGEPAVRPGRSDESALVRFVAGQVEDMEMPPLSKRDQYPAMTKEEIGRLRTWIDQQAPWPEGIKLNLPNP